MDDVASIIAESDAGLDPPLASRTLEAVALHAFWTDARLRHHLMHAMRARGFPQNTPLTRTNSFQLTLLCIVFCPAV